MKAGDLQLSTASSALLLGFGLGETVGLGAGLGDRAVDGEPVDDGCAEAGVGEGRISPEARRLLLRLATARQGRDIADTRKLINECDVLLGRRTPVPAVSKEVRDSAEQWLSPCCRAAVRS